MTIAEIKAAAGGWDAGALEAALAFEQRARQAKGRDRRFGVGASAEGG